MSQSVGNGILLLSDWLEPWYEAYVMVDKKSCSCRNMEAVYDKDHVGTCKQSVSDMKQIFSARIVRFMECKDYTEAKYEWYVRENSQKLEKED